MDFFRFSGPLCSVCAWVDLILLAPQKMKNMQLYIIIFFHRGSLTTNGHLPREVTQSERDLTKVTKVRVRTNNAKDQQQQLMSTSSSTGAIFKPRTKMKTTTMIINQEVVDLTKETKISTTNNVDVVRAPLNWQLVDQTASQLQKVNKCDF